MIKNERQYRITKAQAQVFTKAIQELAESPRSIQTVDGFATIQESALRSQLDDLDYSIHEYEALRDGKVTCFEAENLAELPTILIKARIARGLTQKDLAERLQVKEQQVQRWEANDYSGVAIETLIKTMEALKIVSREKIYVPSTDLTAANFVKNLCAAGISETLLFGRLLPANLSLAFRRGIAETPKIQELFGAAVCVARVFGLKVESLLASSVPTLALNSLVATRFKLPARSSKKVVNAYTFYAHYLATLIEGCVPARATKEFPDTWHTVYRKITESGAFDLRSTLRYFRECGVIVFPLRDSGVFHGAVWKIRERFVIALKQVTMLETRWLYDLLHEIGHIASGHVTDDLSLIEDAEISERSTEVEEKEANTWAVNALFDGDIEQIEDAVVEACNSDTRRLKSAVIEVAHQYNVNVGALANHIAYRMSAEGQNWWSTAHALQLGCVNPFETTRDVLLEELQLRVLNEFDRNLIMRALTEE